MAVRELTLSWTRIIFYQVYIHLRVSLYMLCQYCVVSDCVFMNVHLLLLTRVSGKRCNVHACVLINRGESLSSCVIKYVKVSHHACKCGSVCSCVCICIDSYVYVGRSWNIERQGVGGGEGSVWGCSWRYTRGLLIPLDCVMKQADPYLVNTGLVCFPAQYGGVSVPSFHQHRVTL